MARESGNMYPVSAISGSTSRSTASGERLPSAVSQSSYVLGGELSHTLRIRRDLAELVSVPAPASASTPSWK